MFAAEALLSPHTILIVWGAIGLIVARWSMEDRRWLTVLIAFVAVLIFWRGLPQGEGADEGLQDLLYILSGLGLTLACFLIAWIIQHRLPKVPIVLVAAVAATVGAGALMFSYERPHDPNAACASSGINVAVAGKQMFLPLEIGAELDLSGSDHAGQLLIYDGLSEQSQDVERACSLTNYSTAALKAQAIRFSLHNRTTTIEGNCGLSSHAFCDDFPSVMFGLVTGLEVTLTLNDQLKAVQRKFAPPSEGLEISETPLSISTVRAGTASYCSKEGEDMLYSSCTAWRVLPEGAVLVAKGHKSKKNREAAIVSHDVLVMALDWLEAKLQPLPE